MVSPTPISVEYVDPEDYTGYTPKPYAIIGDAPQAEIPAVALTAVPASFADLAAVRTYLNTLVTELKSSAVFD